MDSKNNFKAIGMMSGTSLDGLDIAYCGFSRGKTGWSYSLDQATTLKYPSSWTKKLSTAHQLSGGDLVALDNEYGRFLGKACRSFVDTHKIKVDFVASHGHTIFHQPSKGFTFQLGSGNALHATCGLPVVSDFRSLDVQLGGEGAPLVPIGDKLLFGEYDVCLNLGGIANLSMDVKKIRRAYDVCFMNMGLNYLAASIGKTYDSGGRMASKGSLNTAMMKKLDSVYDRLRGKRPSLGREIFEEKIQPILDTGLISIEDKMRTLVESAAKEISVAIVSNQETPKVLCTGGGTFNSFFVSCLLDHCGDRAALIIPEELVVKYKEALVFAFLGVLRVIQQPNCLMSVTGAKIDNCGGLLIGR
jgi:anhydro-N-acetylmuramic acid kinase